VLSVLGGQLPLMADHRLLSTDRRRLWYNSAASERQESDMKEWFRRQPKHFTPAARESGQQIPDNMWVKCSSCGELNYAKQLNDNLKVCKCGYHMRLTAREWLGLLDADSGTKSSDYSQVVTPSPSLGQIVLEG